MLLGQRLASQELETPIVTNVGARLDEERSDQRMGNQLTSNLSCPTLESLLQILTKSHQPRLGGVKEGELRLQ
jgi:hypothetical protein